MLINVYLKCIIWWEDEGLEHKKYFARDHLYIFLWKAVRDDLKLQLAVTQ